MAKLQSIADRFAEVEKRVADPDVVADRLKLRDFMMEHKRLKPMADKAVSLVATLRDWDEVQAWIQSEDEELRALGAAEQPVLEAALTAGVEEAKWMLLPHDDADDRDAILEVRAGTGGDEASLFAGDLVRMYLKHADEKGWKHQWLQASEGTVGGFKQAVLRLEGAFTLRCAVSCCSFWLCPYSWSFRSLLRLRPFCSSRQKCCDWILTHSLCAGIAS